MDYVLDVRNLSKTFVNEKGESVEAVGRLSFACRPGEFLCILGPTGCGKTTLLRMLAGLIPPTDGTTLIAGRPLSGPCGDATLVFQQYSLFPWRNVIDNVAFGLEFRGVSRAKRHARAAELLKLVGLENVARSHTYELSGGMQQRVAIARALAVEADVLLMDEPFGALDERTRHRLQEELLRLWEKRSCTIVFVTHNIDEAVFLADRVLVMGSRPSRIAGEVAINLSRPRGRLAAPFADYHLKLRRMLEEDLAE